ncbi:MAG: 50S ribosomal protein L24 [Methanobrevibacter sp.]|jgi:large subunit ribosomal protein L24|nr:50S ribosomal protein L24 [Candidatus Methanovirga basalitermitum]
MSKQPRKQRKSLYNAPLHARRKRMSVNLSKELQEDYGRRSLPVKSGDKVQVVRGDFRNSEGKVEKVDYKNYKVLIDGVTITKTDGTNVFLPVHPSNLLIIDAEMKDDFRDKIIDRKL